MDLQTLTAAQARALATPKLKAKDIRPWVDYIEKAIKQTAKDGCFSLYYPFRETKVIGYKSLPWLTSDMADEIREHFERAGFKWVMNNAEGHSAVCNCSRCYWEISWKD